MPPSRMSRGQQGVSRPAAITAVVSLIAVAVHMCMTAVYNVPWDDVKYDALPGQAADSYMRPYFVQDYRIFAPDPADSDHQLWLRAWIELPDGSRTESEWVNVSEIELAAAYRKVLRKQLTIIGAERVMSAYVDLTDEQQAVVAGNFHQDADLAGMHDSLLEASPENEAAANAFTRASNYIVSYGTQAAYALWGDEGEILGVQNRVVYDPVIRWSDRHDPEAQRPAATYTDLGWRPLMEWPGQDRDAFARTFDGWADQAGVTGELREDPPRADDEAAGAEDGADG